MAVDIVHSQTKILISGLEKEVADAVGQHLASPHTITVDGVMSRKKRPVSILRRVARKWQSSR
jgi:inorganic pyrophosphatase/exopolyphosphatase